MCSEYYLCCVVVLLFDLIHTLLMYLCTQARATYDNYTGSMVTMTDLSSQDPKHKGKRLDMPLQSAAKCMLVGRYCASAIDLFLVRNFFDDEQVRNLRTSDLRRDDRQNFAAVVRRSGKLVTGVLEILQQPGHGGHQTHGTVAVYRMISKYLLIFFSRKLTLKQRVRNAGYVCQFLRLWYVSIKFYADQGERNLQDNFYPFQTYRHVLLSCQSAVLFIIACRELTPEQICGLQFIGSDCCEILFSIIGGWGALASWQRSFTFRGAVYKVADCNALMAMRSQGNVQQQTHRSAKAGEFKHDLHEDMSLDDADLKNYPSNVEIVNAWHAGQDEATALCEQLGMKHRSLTAEMWDSPWLWDPPNPAVPHVDEYLRRKFGEDADPQPPGDDDDDHDDGAPPGADDDNDDDADAVDQMQMDNAINAIRQCVENDVADPDHMIRTPNNKLISKETAICMLREAFDTDGKISKDRLKRIVQCASRSQQDVTELDVDEDDTNLELHKDVALSFDAGDGGPLQLWFGRVQKMVVRSATGRRTLRLGSIPLDNRPEGLMVMCNYYDKVPRRPRTYRYGARALEVSFYPASSIICVVHFDYNTTSRTYTVPIDQWNHIRSELRRLQNNRSR